MLRTDFILYRENGGLAALVQSSAQFRMDAHAAAEFRRNLLSARELPDAPFFLIVTPKHVFVWKDAGLEPEVVAPHAVLPSEILLSRFYANPNITPHRVDRDTFRMVVEFWLSDLGDPNGYMVRTARENGLAELVDALRLGTINVRDAA